MRKLKRLVLFFEGTDSGDRQNASNAELLEAINVGAEVEFMWKDAVALSVTRQECHATPQQRAHNVGVRRRPERCCQSHFLDVCEVRN
jgi:hypothetical protein